MTTTYCALRHTKKESNESLRSMLTADVRTARTATSAPGRSISPVELLTHSPLKLREVTMFAVRICSNRGQSVDRHLQRVNKDLGFVLDENVYFM